MGGGKVRGVDEIVCRESRGEVARVVEEEEDDGGENRVGLRTGAAH